MAKSMKLAKLLGGCAAAGIAAVAVSSSQPLRAAPRGGKGLQVQNIGVAKATGVVANRIIEVKFNQSVDRASVNPATFQVRARNSTDKGFTKQVFGTFQVVGNAVRFYPRLPTHLRDASGAFFPEGHELDDAARNAGLQPGLAHEIRLIGKPAATAIRSTSGSPLKNTTTAQFTTAAASPPEKLWSAQFYSDSPPPQFQFSNPPDTVPTAQTQYATHGGTQDVPSSLVAQLFCTKVPIAPGTARNVGNVELTMLARRGDYSLRRPVQGSVFVEQNFDTTLLAFRPRVALADLGTYGLRVAKGVKDLTELHDFAPSPARARLRAMYDFLSAARALSPGVPYEQLIDPPGQFVGDWPRLLDINGDTIPGAAAARGVLKANLLVLGDTYPDEIDPRIMVIFTSRDEPVTEDSITVEFTKLEGLFDANISTGEVDTDVPGAASAIFTFAAGSGADGDYLPTGANVTLSSDTYPLGEANFRNVIIPAGTTINLAGSRPFQMKALTITINGTILANGKQGTSIIDANQQPSYSYYYDAAGTGLANTLVTRQYGGPGGPVATVLPQAPLGGGRGGNSSTINLAAGGTGGPGRDTAGNPASPIDGGQGGIGGINGYSTVNYPSGGAGGGGGARGNGGAGVSQYYSSYTTWYVGASGTGGQGAGANDDLNPLVGGAGGGSGGGAVWQNGTGTYSKPGSGGSSGGGAFMIQTAGVLTIGNTGLLRARGGDATYGTVYPPPSGTTYAYFSGGPGGAGGGGSILLRSTKGFAITNPLTSLDVRGGAAGGGGGLYTTPGNAGSAGAGGNGFLRLEDPTGGLAVPGHLQGDFSPVGAGVPSVIYTKWADLGVQDPRILQWKLSDIETTTINDAIYVQAQMTRESSSVFGTPDTTALNAAQNSTNLTVTSQWTPIKVHDLTGVVGGAFASSLGPIPGWSNLGNPPTEYTGFDISALNGKAYRFIRYRIYFQLDATQAIASPKPFVERIKTTFQFNF